jgi:hypothetical protein
MPLNPIPGDTNEQIIGAGSATPVGEDAAIGSSDHPDAMNRAFRLVRC